MNKIALFVFYFAFYFDVCGQHNFPTPWLGSYEGIMQIENLSGVVDSVYTRLDFLAKEEKNHWTYRFTFKSEKWGEIINDYEMYWHDSLQSPNNFILDEHNGLFLNEQFVNKRFYGHYEVEDIHYTTLLQRLGEKLYFEIRCTDPKKGIKSNSIPDPQGAVFNVSTYYQFMLQHVLLSRIKI